jgi:two-component system sensor histidine kinase/response regulator
MDDFEGDKTENLSRIEAELQENEERWQLVLDGTRDGIWDWNLKTNELFLSPRWQEMLGYQDGELIGSLDTWRGLLHSEDRQRVIETLQNYLGQEIPNYEVQFRLRCRGGNYKWILSRGKALWDKNGQPLRMAGSHTDIDVAKQREAERKAEQILLQKQADKDNLLSRMARQLIEQNLDSAIKLILEELGKFSQSDRAYIIDYSPCQREWSMAYEWYNRENAQVTSILAQSQNLSTDKFIWFSRQLLLGNPIKIDALEKLPEEAICERQALENSPTPCILIVPMVDRTAKTVGYLGLDAVATKVWSPEDVQLLRLVGEFIAIAQDRYKAEIALKTAKEAADTANRAKSEFLAHMSHELRTPLNAILGFTQVMSRDSSLDEENKNHLQIINRSGEHLLELINDILEMSKIEAGKSTFNQNNFDLYELLSNLAEMLKPRAEAKNLQLIFECSRDVPQFIQTDEGKLRQVLINLVSNGIKFTDSGGVTLRVKAQDSERLWFEVEDTGSGIESGEIEALFAAFTQSESGRKSQQGTGLGLPISKKFVQLMGGTIKVTSQVAQGSIFAFDILAQRGHKLEPTKSQPLRRVVGLAPHQPSYRILVVDDRLESRLLLVKLLSSVGFLVQQAKNGQEAIEIWEKWQPHLIWMDMRMPIINGYEATRHIKSTSHAENTVIIALTASAFEEDRTTVLQAGCDDFMRKPFREELLWEKMSYHLGVEYLYQDTDSPPEMVSPNLQQQINLLSLDWIRQLQQSAQECSDDSILELVSQLPPEQRVLAQALQDLSHNFLFDSILELTQNYGE